MTARAGEVEEAFNGSLAALHPPLFLALGWSADFPDASGRVRFQRGSGLPLGALPPPPPPPAPPPPPTTAAAAGAAGAAGAEAMALALRCDHGNTADPAGTLAYRWAPVGTAQLERAEC